MAKVLISFVGTGPLKENNESKREYKTTDYHIGNVSLGDYPFVAAALTKYHAVNKVILIGTARSMWEEVYRYFSETKGIEPDDDKYFSISNYCSEANSSTELSVPYISDVEKAIGSSKILIIKYGMNEQEISENMERVLSLKDEFSENDEIIVDVTHSFRSIPLMIMNLLIYMKNVSRKKITISHIYYGMLEVIREKDYAPIVDLKNVLAINDWITGAYSFSQYGNAHMISKLLENDDKDLATRLMRFSNVMNLNHLDAIESEIGSFKSLKKKEYTSPLAELIVQPVVDDFVKQFGALNENHAKFQYRLARWQFDHMNYATALISLQEAIITYACQKKNKDWKDINNREEEKKNLSSSRNKLGIWYKKIRKMRNCVAHSIESAKNAQSMINEMNAALQELKDELN